MKPAGARGRGAPADRLVLRALAAVARLLVLAASAATCASLAGLAALFTQGQALPPSDGAYGLSVRESLADPFVRDVWLGLVAIGAALGFLVSAWALWRVKLTRAVPVVAAVTVLAAALTGPIAPAAGPAALAAGVLAMLWCRGRSGWAVAPRTR